MTNIQNRPVFDGGVNVAVKIPLDRYDKTIQFYRDILGFKLTPYFHEFTGQSHYCRFGTLTLWLDRVDYFSQTDIWFELNTDNIVQARNYLSENGVNFRPELEKLPEDLKADWISDPAGVVMILKEDERLKKTE
ncbi:VOC family protein [Dyadobacter koreensis]|nr:VOC family protein [Dyadobacter koreensis]